ncbi:MAG: hypothetical protein ACRCYU_12385 [Nocardioides sp.]
MSKLRHLVEVVEWVNDPRHVEGGEAIVMNDILIDGRRLTVSTDGVTVRSQRDGLTTVSVDIIADWVTHERRYHPSPYGSSTPQTSDTPIYDQVASVRRAQPSN